MKKITYYSTILAIAFYSCCSCNIYRPSGIVYGSYVPYGDDVAKLLLFENDTVYRYSWENIEFPRCSDISYIWYHKNNYIHLHLLQEGRCMRYIEIPAINYAVEDTIAEYEYDIMSVEPKHGECFYSTLDGTLLDVYIKNENDISFSVDDYCLKNEECEKGTFKYKLQYDLKKVLESLRPYW